jgi:integration host factor subunit alpha
MRKIEIAHRMHQEAGISEQEAASLLNWVLELFKSTLQQGEPVSIFNFGVFTVRNKASRRGRNPRTGEELIISSRRVVNFHASPRLKAEVNDDVCPQPQIAEGAE